LGEQTSFYAAFATFAPKGALHQQLKLAQESASHLWASDFVTAWAAAESNPAPPHPPHLSSSSRIDPCSPSPISPACTPAQSAMPARSSGSCRAYGSGSGTPRDHPGSRLLRTANPWRAQASIPVPSPQRAWGWLCWGLCPRELS